MAPTMMLNFLATVAFFGCCGRSLAFVVVVKHPAVGPGVAISAPPAMFAISATSAISGCTGAGPPHRSSKPRRDRCRCPLMVTSGSRSSTSSENNIATAKGLTTCSSEAQGIEGGRGGRLHLESDIFVPEPGSTVSLDFVDSVHA